MASKEELAEFRAEENEFYAHIGRAIVTWGGIEANLVHVFQMAVSGDSAPAASAALYSVVNFRAKLEMVTATLNIRLCTSPELLDEWSKLKKRLDSASKQRAAIAHYQVQAWGQLKPGRRYMLSQHYSDANYTIAGGKKRKHINANDLKVRADTFEKLAKEIWNFFKKARNAPEPPPEFFGQNPADFLPKN